jgi:hypothetical protein
MRIRLVTALALVLVLVGSLAAAENPFAGTWKSNPAKSKLTGDTMKFAKTEAGAIRWSGSGLSYTFKMDGKEYKGPLGEAVVWKQIDDSTWETTYTRKGTLVDTDTSKLSPDGKTLTVVSKGTKPNGETFEDTTVYERISGEKGLFGGWKDKQVKVSAPSTLEIASSGKDGILFKSVDYKWTADAQFDGKDYPATGPTMPEHVMLTLKHTGPRSFEMVVKQNGKALSRDSYRVSQDGRTLTVAGSPIAVNEPYTVVYEKQ